MTGTSGFVGKNFVDLLYREYDIYNLGRQHVNGTQHVPVESYQRVNLDDIIKQIRPDIFLHLGWSGVLGSERNSVQQIKNLEFAHSLISACIDNEVGHFIGMGSQAEYGLKQGKISIFETCNPTTLYGICKLATYQMLNNITRGTPTKFSWVRLFSGYGPGENEHWLIPSLIRAMVEGKSLKVTKGEQLWDFVHSYDIACALRSILEHGAEGVFNLGSGRTIRLMDLFEFIQKESFNGGVFDIGAVPYRPDQVMHLEADISELQKIGWAPSKDLKTELIKTIKVRTNSNEAL